MIRLCTGNIFDADVDIRVNTVNCVGAMGAGVALAFKTRYPEMFREYKKACKDGRIQPGKIHVWKQLDGTWIINFPTKRHWREPSRYEDIKAGLADLRSYLQEQGHISIAIPALGCGHGGLDWDRVKDLITDALGDLDAEILLYEPSSSRAAGEQVKGGIDPHVVEQLEREGVSILKPGDALYPEAIRGVRATTVFVKGNPEVLARPLLAVFPSRKPNEKEVAAATACIEAIAKPGMTILLGYGPHIDRDLIRLALSKGALVAVRFEEGISSFRIRKDIEDVWEDERIAVIATEATGRWNLHTGRKMTGLALDLAKVALVTDPNPQWMQRFADDATRATQVFFIDYHTSSPAAKQALMSVGAKPVRRDARSGNPSVDEIVNALGVGESPVPTSPGKQPVKQAETHEKTSSMKHDEIMPRYPKRLIEVDLPVKAISRNASAEMEKRRGHVPMMHIWWAHRPPVACRAILLASLLPDPVDHACSEQFITKARDIVRDYWGSFGGPKRDLGETDGLRQALLDIVSASAEYEFRTNARLLEILRRLIHAAHAGSTPTLLDPFSGGGIIPFEGVRLGLDTTATDLNPVATLISKSVVEYLPKYGHALVDEIEYWAQELHRRLREQLAQYYPAVLPGESPVSYLWARQIRCEGPGCGAEVPMVRQLWLSRKGNSKAAIKLIPNPERKHIAIDVIEDPSPSDMQTGTVRGGAVTCPVCGYTTKGKSVKAQIAEHSGGANSGRLLAVVTTVVGQRGRRYRAPRAEDVAAARDAALYFDQHRDELWPPDEPLPGKDKHRAVGSQLPLYGFRTWSDLFTKRQLLALCTLARLINEVWPEILERSENQGMAEAVSAQLAPSLCVWQTHAGIPAHLFGRKALPWITDFAEAVPVGESSGTLVSGLKRTVTVLREYASMKLTPGVCLRADATKLPLPDGSYDVCFTDPPYYDSVPYADLSDFFYVWLKRSAGKHLGGLLTDELTDKGREATVNHPKSDEERARYAGLLQEAWREARRTLKDDGLLIVVFAHKSTAAWESIMESLLDSDLTVTASWPVDTEMRSRMNAKETASLSSSIHLVCRPRPSSPSQANVGDWRDILSELPTRIGEWLPRLADEGIVGADAIFACLGPALEIFSRYSRVEKASGEQVPLREYLEHVWAAVSQEALRMVFEGADTTAFEEDARLTAMWLWTLKADTNGNGKDEDTEAVSSGGYVLEYDAARKIAQGLGAHLDVLSNLVEIKGDKARLLPVDERGQYLFGKTDSPATASRKKKRQQRSLFEEMDEAEAAEGGWGEGGAPNPGQTTLDRVHQAMLLFASGRGEALKRFLVEEGIGRDSRFWTLAQALSALYPSNTQEKRWVDGVLARKKGLGF